MVKKLAFKLLFHVGFNIRLRVVSEFCRTWTISKAENVDKLLASNKANGGQITGSWAYIYIYDCGPICGPDFRNLWVNLRHWGIHFAACGFWSSWFSRVPLGFAFSKFQGCCVISLFRGFSKGHCFEIGAPTFFLEAVIWPVLWIFGFLLDGGPCAGVRFRETL